MKKFTDNLIKSLKPRDKRYFLREAGNEGFGVRVTPSGKKSFYYVYKFGGSNKLHWLRLGEYPDKTLTTARQEYRKMRAMRDAGNNPAETTLQQKMERRTAWTIDTLCDEFLEKYSRVRKRPRSAREDELNLARDVRRLWGRRKARDITRGDIIALIDEIVSRGSNIQANRSHATISKMFAWAFERELIPTNPAIGISKQTAEVPKERCLNNSEISELWNKLSQNDILPPAIAKTLMIILLTGLRPGEVINAKWSQVDGDWLELQSDSTKNKKTHRIYFSKLTRQIIGAQSDGYIIERESIKRLETYTLSAWIRRHNFLDLDKWTPHDLRRTCSSKLAELGVMPHVIAKILNHTETSVTGRVYNQYRYSVEVQDALTLWSNRVEVLTSTMPTENSKVISIKR